ncbi:MULTISPECIES: heavy-metal-associated domain-containing protein [Ramlibacter]|uniref:Heavy-metal-associated domain-containing protein n=1 Tax=Ramlibacter aquaticus TaxID=2780094 RepID=A0ABR9SC15_9BURK|nr:MULTISPECIES: heavy-metal-associated domain-containing protein [Ramlibacter]MBE7939873.1 heavy-metal-associated domain-containing protein [Ramlibacter aquaticus]
MIEFKLPQMSCGHCVRAVTEAVQSVDPQAKVQVDLQAKTAQVESQAQREQIGRALAEAGYAPA